MARSRIAILARIVLACAASVTAAGCKGSDATGPTINRLPNSITLRSDVGDYVGSGKSFSYSQANAIITVAATGGHLSIKVEGDEVWFGDFTLPNTVDQIKQGTYADLQRYPFHDPAKGGVNWTGNGRGCNTLQGAFNVDHVTYTEGVLTAVDIRFEQHCEGAASSLNGTIHWRSDDTSTPLGPRNPPPAELWRPTPGSTPASGNFVYLESDQGDFVGQGGRNTYTAAIAVSTNAGRLSVAVDGSQFWNGEFQAMNTLNSVQPGFYDGLRRWPFHNPAKGGLTWYGEGRGCNTLAGWFVIDNVTYIGAFIRAVDLRFEQHCEGGAPSLHGAVHWSG